jgi:hypothetical protein
MASQTGERPPRRPSSRRRALKTLMVFVGGKPVCVIVPSTARSPRRSSPPWSEASRRRTYIRLQGRRHQPVRADVQGFRQLSRKALSHELVYVDGGQRRLPGSASLATCCRPNGTAAGVVSRSPFRSNG